MEKSPFQRRAFDTALVAKALRDPAFKKRLLADPKAAYAAELGRPIPDEAKIIVVEERPDTFYVVLPYLPESITPPEEVIDAVAQRILTHREPCWGLGDRIE